MCKLKIYLSSIVFIALMCLAAQFGIVGILVLSIITLAVTSLIDWEAVWKCLNKK